MSTPKIHTETNTNAQFQYGHTSTLNDFNPSMNSICIKKNVQTPHDFMVSLMEDWIVRTCVLVRSYSILQCQCAGLKMMKTIHKYTPISLHVYVCLFSCGYHFNGFHWIETLFHPLFHTIIEILSENYEISWDKIKWIFNFWKLPIVIEKGFGKFNRRSCWIQMWFCVTLNPPSTMHTFISESSK